MKQFLRSCMIPLVVVGLLGGCATAGSDFSTRPELWEQKQAVVGVAVAELPKPTTYKGGSEGIFDFAINDAKAKPLERHLSRLDISNVTGLSDRIAAYLRSRGVTVRQIKKPIKVADLKKLDQDESSPPDSHRVTRDFRPLKQKYGVDKLVLITVTQVGTIRNYFGFFPIGAPSGIASLAGQAIDLTTNTLEWNQTITRTVPSADRNWNEPPQYPGLTKAVLTALDQSRDLLYNRFVQ